MSDNTGKNDQPLDRILQAMKDRDHDTEHARPQDRKDLGEEPGHWLGVTERSDANDFATSLQIEYGVEISDIRSNKDDPPDCWAERNGKKIGIEITTVGKDEIFRKIARSKREGSTYPASERFNDEIWSKEQFILKVTDRLHVKNVKAEKKGRIFDYLVIATGELDLDYERVGKWLAQHVFDEAEFIKEAYFLGTYHPRHSTTHKPIFKLQKRER